MLKIDVVSMINRLFKQLINRSFGWRFPTLQPTSAFLRMSFCISYASSCCLWSCTHSPLPFYAWASAYHMPLVAAFDLVLTHLCRFTHEFLHIICLWLLSLILYRLTLAFLASFDLVLTHLCFFTHQFLHDHMPLVAAFDLDLFLLFQGLGGLVLHQLFLGFCQL